MTLLMARIDDRLVHGQVIVGCCEPLGGRRILVCDDVVSRDSVRQSLFAAAVPPDIEVEFLEPARCPARLQALSDVGENAVTILLTRDCATMRTLVESGSGIDRVVVGGLHRRPGAVEVVEGFHLTEADRNDLVALIRAGCRVAFQSVPGAAEVGAETVLGDTGTSP
ncbi:MAG TPA: PTS sugar transporter subunit IIB [Candidatus Krumholzibacteria bacterium]|nr:PTS sugar transporter subunit IIB [Candidatus Krumholzibacteria bacterium]